MVGAAIVVVGGAMVVVGGAGIVVAVVVASVVVCAVVVGSVVVAAVVCSVVVCCVDCVLGGAVTLGDESPESPPVVTMASVTPAASRTPAMSSASGTIQRERVGRGRARGMTCVGSPVRGSATIVAVPPRVPAARSSASSAAPSCGRSAGCLAREASAVAASCAGASGRISETDGGSSARCIATSAIAFGDSNGSRPVSIRKSITPAE